MLQKPETFTETGINVNVCETATLKRTGDRPQDDDGGQRRERLLRLALLLRRALLLLLLAVVVNELLSNPEVQKKNRKVGR